MESSRELLRVSARESHREMFGVVDFDFAPTTNCLGAINDHLTTENCLVVARDDHLTTENFFVVRHGVLREARGMKSSRELLRVIVRESHRKLWGMRRESFRESRKLS